MIVIRLIASELIVVFFSWKIINFGAGDGVRNWQGGAAARRQFHARVGASEFETTPADARRSRRRPMDVQGANSDQHSPNQVRLHNHFITLSNLNQIGSNAIKCNQSTTLHPADAPLASRMTSPPTINNNNLHKSSHLKNKKKFKALERNSPNVDSRMKFTKVQLKLEI